MRHLAWRVAAVLTLWSVLQVGPALSARSGGGSNAVAVVSQIVVALQTGSRGRAATVIRNSLSIDAIAKTIAGRSWSGASGKQKREFMDALLHATIATMSSRLKERRNTHVDVGGVRSTAKGDTLVSTKVTRSSGRIVRIDWRLRRCATGLCVVDLIVDGGSMAIQLRDQATPILSANGGGIAVLTQRLRSRPTHPFS